MTAREPERGDAGGSCSENGTDASQRQLILLVDDNDDLVRHLTLLLRNVGYEVRSLASGVGVAEAVALHRPALLVLDVMMPNVDGYEVLRRIRENPVNSELPIMMLTAKGTEEAKVRGFSLGADDYLVKPFSIREFACRVQALLRRVPPRDDGLRIPVVAGDETRLLRLEEVEHVQGVRNYSYVYARGGRFLCRDSLGTLEAQDLPGLMRVHRSHIVRLAAVVACHRTPSGSFMLRLDDGVTEIPVSRSLVREVRERLGIG